MSHFEILSLVAERLLTSLCLTILSCEVGMIKIVISSGYSED